MANGAIARRQGEGRRLWIVGDEMEIKATGEDTGGKLALFDVIARPGGGPPPHTHANEDEFWFVIEGEFEILQGEETVRLGPGGYAYVPRGMLHRFENVGDRDGRVLVGFTPAGMEGFFLAAGLPVVEGESAPPLGPEEIERSRQAAIEHGMDVRWPDMAER